ncbi:hypothetical protein LTSERUB_6000 [Salmonella enterica subsp. enterica serovar Rubislaw str. A4-653]|uniref:Uncharacterized protein n=1 Tax=Salmonella enterica subsp. enterica serovar Rubislaw str. A4-653 TaxID=913081 RepID=G5QS40_SALRU|nr:hypothetical protein LTSERUB_6000 [Salmonella enterica subsp. enterica serovar Rubislaw str. A4-653]
MLKRNRKSRVKCNNAEMRYTCRFLTQAASFFFYFFCASFFFYFF